MFYDTGKIITFQHTGPAEGDGQVPDPRERAGQHGRRHHRHSQGGRGDPAVQKGELREEQPPRTQHLFNSQEAASGVHLRDR